MIKHGYLVPGKCLTGCSQTLPGEYRLQTLPLPSTPHIHTLTLFFDQEPESCLVTEVVNSSHLLCSSLGLQTSLSTIPCSALTLPPLKCSEGHASHRAELHVWPIHLGAGPYALRIQQGSLLSLTCLPAACVLLWSLGHLSVPPRKRTPRRESGATFGSRKINDFSSALLCYWMQLETSMEKSSVLLWCPRPSMKTWCVWPNGLRKWSSCKETEQILQHWLWAQLTIASVWTKNPSCIGQSCAHIPSWICFPRQF